MKGWMRWCAASAAAALLLLCSCTRGADKTRYFAYLDAPAQCALSGNINGTPFRATLQSEGRSVASGEIADCSADFTLTYLAPDALAGVKVSYDGKNKVYQVTLGELHAKGEAYAALGDVGALLMTESAVTSTSRTQDGGISFDTMDGAARVIDEQGRPVSVRRCDGGRCIEVEICDWRQE